MDLGKLKALAEGARGDGYSEDGAFEFRLKGPRLMLELIAENERLLEANGCVDDLSALVRQLAQRLRKSAPDSDLPEKALDYLKRKGLQGSPLRGSCKG